MSEKQISESELEVDGEISFYEGTPFTGVCVLLQEYVVKVY